MCRISFDTLLEIQLEAERRDWATRWTSVDALRSQVKEEFVVLQSLMREERGGVLRAYRCLLLFSAVDVEESGGITTIDLAPGEVRVIGAPRSGGRCSKGACPGILPCDGRDFDGLEKVAGHAEICGLCDR